jgi:hypothetical protein
MNGVHYAPSHVRNFDKWKCGAPAYSHEAGSTSEYDVTCFKCRKQLEKEKEMNSIDFQMAFKNHWEHKDFAYLVKAVEAFVIKYPDLTYYNPSECEFQAKGRLTKQALLDLIEVVSKTTPDELCVTTNSFRMWWD